MNGQRSGRVYLAEVLVALFAVGLLAALFLPMWQQTRSRSYATCSNNLRQCALGLMQYAETHRQFPGYANVIGGKRASWVVPILPQLERNDLYQNWSNESIAPIDCKRPDLVAGLSQLVCPNDPARGRRADELSYVVNSGSARTANDFLPPIPSPPGWVEDVNAGLFFNRARADYAQTSARPNPYPRVVDFHPDQAPSVTLDFLSQHDGNTYTLLLSENLQATTWATDPNDENRPYESEFQMRQNTSFVWFLTGKADNAYPPTDEVLRQNVYGAQSIPINGQKDKVTPVPIRYHNQSHFGGLTAARPSSHHPGGVNAMFCGGHATFLADDIDYRVYTQLMTPNGADVVVDITAAGDPVTASAPSGSSKRVATPWQYRLKQNDF